MTRIARILQLSFRLHIYILIHISLNPERNKKKSDNISFYILLPCFEFLIIGQTMLNGTGLISAVKFLMNKVSPSSFDGIY